MNVEHYLTASKHVNVRVYSVTNIYFTSIQKFMDETFITGI